MTTPTLRLRVLGEFSLRSEEQELSSLTPPRLRSLLTYLVLHRASPQPRQQVAFLLWPDAGEAQARNNLRQLLHQLRQAWPGGEQLLTTDAQLVQWHPSRPYWVDVVAFEEALEQAEAIPRTGRADLAVRQEALEQAEQVYRGDILPGCYEDWITPERERLRRQHQQLLEELLNLAEEQGAYVAAIGYAQRLLELDPLREALYRRLMALFVETHDRARALHVYHTCVSTLDRELGVEPDPTTRAVYELLLQPQPPERTQEPPAPGDPPSTASIESEAKGALLVGLPALIGRAPEWEILEDAWRSARAGQPRFVLVTGEAGIGKSRLAEEFVRWTGTHGAVSAQTRSYAAEGQLSLAPVIEWLRSAGLRGTLGQLDQVWLTEVARILPELSAEYPGLPRYETVGEYGQRQRFFEALARAVLGAPQPLVLLLDDVQWCDQETLEWLHFLLRYAAGASLLVIGCAREEELPPLHPLGTLLLHLRSTMGVTELALQPLDAAETGKLAAQVAQKELALEAVMRLYHETGGYPLFVVEMVRAGLGREPAFPRTVPDAPQRLLSMEAVPEESRTLPPRVHAVLVGRLRQVSVATREWMELAATIGREFTLDFLISVGTGDADSAVRALDELWQRRIVREHGANRYDFTHDRLQEVAYAEISAPQRRMLHRRIAEALEASSAGDGEAVSGQIAWQYERAGLVEQALPFYQRAAAVAQQVYANADAIGLLSHGLDLLERLPAGLLRDQKELRLHLALAPLYRVTKGWAAPELEQALDRALALCDTVGNDTQRAQTLYGLQSVYVVQAKLAWVQIGSDDLHLLYQRSLGTDPPPFADMMLAGARLHMGRISEANTHFAAIIAARDPDHLLHLQESQGSNYEAHARAWQSHALWCLGYPDQALRLGQEAVRQVEDLDQPFNQALVSAYLALLQQLCGEETVARAHAEQALALATQYQATYYRAWSSILVRYAEAWEQTTEAAIGQLRAAIAEFTASSARLRLPYYLWLLAGVYRRAGRLEEGLAAIEEGLRAARAQTERWWDADLHRLRGEFLLVLRGADTTDGEAALLRAIEIAQTQEAKSLELRATTSLARVWMSGERAEEARQRLTEVYNWFTEGFATPDLRAARMLLGE